MAVRKTGTIQQPIKEDALFALCLPVNQFPTSWAAPQFGQTGEPEALEPKDEDELLG